MKSDHRRDDDLPEVAAVDDLPIALPRDAEGMQPAFQNWRQEEVLKPENQVYSTEKETVQPRPRVSRRRWIIFGTVLGVVILAVGLGAGLSVGLNSDSSKSLSSGTGEIVSESTTASSASTTTTTATTVALTTASSTCSGVTSGTTGVACVSCNQTGAGSGYTTTTGSTTTEFHELCNIDMPTGSSTYNATSNGGSETDVVSDIDYGRISYSFTDCMDQCARYNQQFGTTSEQYPCLAVTYGANLTAAFARGTSGNCYLKNARGVGQLDSSEDVIQKLISLLATLTIPKDCPGCTMYQSLPPENSIRLLQILDCTPKTLTLELSTHRLDEVGYAVDSPNTSSYDALSYTWGAPISGPEVEKEYAEENDVEVTIVAAGEQHQTRMGRNVYEALIAIWDSGRRRRLWVDGLCINQDDIAERSHQVAMMGDIYSEATEVLVWFGRQDQEDPGFKNFIWIHTDFLDQLQAWQDVNGAYDPAMHLAFGDDNDEIEFTQAELTIPKDAVKALFKFYATRRYLHRAWIVQEVALSREPVALLGASLVPMGNIGVIVNYIRENDNTGMFVQHHLRGENEGSGYELDAIAYISYKVASSREGEVHDYANYGATDEVSRYWSAWYELLAAGHQPRSRDPRDAIYSLLGVVHSMSNPRKVPNALQPDYNRSVEEVYSDFTVRMLQSMPFRTILSLVGHRTPSDLASSLASWVPDYSSCRRFGLGVERLVEMETGTFPSYNAAAVDDTSHASLTIDGNELRLFARHAGRISASHQLITQRYEANDPKTAMDAELRDSLDSSLWALKLAVESQSQDYATGESLVQALFRILGFSGHNEEDSATPFIEKMNNYLTNAILSAELSLRHEASPIITPDLVNELKQILQHFNDPGVPKAEYLKSQLEARDQVISPDEDEIKEMNKEERAARAELLTSLLSTSTNRLPVRWMEDASRLFSTDSGYWGRVTNDVHVGDELWLLCRAKCPFVLRPINDGKYRLLGEAFVPGAMYGELIDKGVAKNTQQITLV